MPEHRPLTADDLWELPRVGAPSASADGGVVVYGVTTHPGDGTPLTQLRRLHTDGRSTPLTNAAASASAPAVSPDGAAVAFLRTVDDHPQVHLLPLDGGEARVLTDLPLGALGPVRWVDADRLLVATTVARDGGLEATTAHVEAKAARTTSGRATERALTRFWDTWLDTDTSHALVLVDVTEGRTNELTAGADLVLALPGGAPATEGLDVRDGWVVFAGMDAGDERHGVPRSELWAVPLDASRRPRLLTDPAADGGGCLRPRFVDDHTIVHGAARELDFYASPVDLLTLRVDLAAGSATPGAPIATALDHQPTQWLVDGDRLVYVAEERGRARVFARPLLGDAAAPSTPLTPLDGTFGAPVRAGDRLLGTLARVDLPPQVAEIADDGRVAVLTDHGTDLLATRDLGLLHERTVAGASGDDVQVLVITPPGWSDDGSWPLVHLVHGGPHGLFGDAWSWRWNAQAVAAAGYVVAMVNFHGSTSFGHAFTASIQGDWMTMPVADVLAATDDLVAAGWVDGTRLGIAGGSYGGYLVTQLATHTDRFRCVVAHAAVTDFAGMYASDVTVGLGRSFGAELFDDERRMAIASPNARYATYDTPTLVVHGDQDLRVPVAQGLALYGVLKAKGVPARLLHYPDENHWILQRDNSRQWYSEVLAWLDRHLAPAG